MDAVESNLRLLRTLVDAYNARDYETIRKHFCSDVELRRPYTDLSLAARRDFVGTYRADAAIEVLKGIIEETGGVHFEARKLESHGPSLGFMELVLHIGPEDRIAHQMAWVVLTFRDGKVAGTETFTTEDAARRVLDHARQESEGDSGDSPV
jgi:ketosteroid isomerase-like protein